MPGSAPTAPLPNDDVDEKQESGCPDELQFITDAQASVQSNFANLKGRFINAKDDEV